MVSESRPGTEGEPDAGRGRRLTAVGAASTGVGAALLASATAACCSGPVVAPLVVAVLGAGGAAWAAGLKPYAVPLLLGSLALLGIGFRLTARPRGGGGVACRRSRLPVRGILWLSAALWLVAAGIVAWSWLATPTPTDHEIVETIDDLRARFNADVGRVRAIFLASPT